MISKKLKNISKLVKNLLRKTRFLKQRIKVSDLNILVMFQFEEQDLNV